MSPATPGEPASGARHGASPSAAAYPPPPVGRGPQGAPRPVLLPPWDLAAEAIRCLSYLPGPVGWAALLAGLGVGASSSLATETPTAWRLWPRLRWSGPGGVQLVRPLATVQAPGATLLLETSYGEGPAEQASRMRRARDLVATLAAERPVPGAALVGLVSAELTSPLPGSPWCGLSELLDLAAAGAVRAAVPASVRRCLHDVHDRLMRRGLGGPAGLLGLGQDPGGWAPPLAALRAWRIERPFAGFGGLPEGPASEHLTWDPIPAAPDPGPAAPSADRRSHGQ